MGQDTLSPKAEVEISRFLSFVLRHEPEAIGLHLTSEGWANISELLQCAAAHKKNLTVEQIHRVAANSDKKRFAISEDGLQIRAVQGHSSKQVDIGFAPRIPPEMLYHGTASRFLESIRAKGLLPGERQYVHLSADYATAETVGKRHGKPVVLQVQAAAMVTAGMEFYLADNGVWLTREVPAAYLAE